MKTNKILIMISIIALILFSGCSSEEEIKQIYNISIGEVEEYIEYYPETWSSSEKCMLIINGTKQIISDNICDKIQEGDIIYKRYNLKYYAYEREGVLEYI